MRSGKSENRSLREKTKKDAPESPLQIIWSVFTWVIVLAMVLLAIALVGVRIVGYTPYAIQSPSMASAYPVGSLVYVKERDPMDIEIGDTITYEMADRFVTHRVVKIDRDAGVFYPKGDANEQPDGPVSYENVKGVVCFSLPYLGNVSLKPATSAGRYMLIGVVFFFR